jgi:hypothetical protein
MVARWGRMLPTLMARSAAAVRKRVNQPEEVMSLKMPFVVLDPAISARLLLLPPIINNS